MCVTYSDLWVDVIVDADDTRVYLHHRFYGNLKAQTTHLPFNLPTYGGQQSLFTGGKEIDA